jgi:hypothetical protein
LTTQTTQSAPTRLSQHRALLDADAIGAAAPIVVLVVVGALRKGGFFKPDVVVLPCLCLALALVSPPVLRWLRANPVPFLLGAAAVAWWVIEAVVWKHDVESWRMPATWLCAAASYGATRALHTTARKVVAAAITALGLAFALIGLALVAARSTTWTWPDERSLRFQGPLTYPSAIGLFLLVTLFASSELQGTAKFQKTELDDARAARGITAARALILLGTVATDSRGTLVALLVMLCFRSVRRWLGPALVAAAIAAPLLLYGQRDGVRPLLIAAAVVVALVVCTLPNSFLRKGIVSLAGPAVVVAGFLLATQHHDVSGLDASWTERGHILRGALTVFNAHPLFGAGADPWIPTHTLSGAPGVDAFAHNEPLEVLISVGVVGTVFVAIAIAAVVRALLATRGAQAVPLLATVGAAGVVDFVWHFPAIGLLAGVVAAIGARHE